MDGQQEIRFPSLRSEARETGAEIRVVVEGHMSIDFPREESLTQRAPRNEADPKFLDGRQHSRFRISRPERVFVLDGGDWMDGVGATDRLGTRFGEAEVPDLALLNQLLHRSSHVFDRHLRIDTVLVEQIDHVGLEPPERRLGDLLDVLRPAVEARECGQVEAMFRGDLCTREFRPPLLSARETVTLPWMTS